MTRPSDELYLFIYFHLVEAVCWMERTVQREMQCGKNVGSGRGDHMIFRATSPDIQDRRQCVEPRTVQSEI
jgi:hypothetical protein